MGYTKHELIEEEDRLFDESDNFICPGCVTDPVLGSILSAAGEQEACSYCGTAPAAPMSVLLEEIEAAIVAEYTDPAEELSYSSEEGGYLGEVLEGEEVVRDHLDTWTENDDLLEEAAQAFGQSCWTRRNAYGIGPFEALKFGWQQFADQVKYRTRFLFLLEGDDEHGHPDEIPPARMLDALEKLFHEYKLFSVLSLGGDLVRVRVVREGELPSTAAELGTAPRERATSPNRMSPAGIPMFYAAFDEETAALETYEPRRGRRRHLAIARFRSTRPLTLLDLTSLPDIPSQFDRANFAKRAPITFLHSFAQDLTRPIERDGRAHAEYAPTQVVTEFVRHRMRAPGGENLDGIRYRSSRADAADAVVIFAEPKHCGPAPSLAATGPLPLLELSSVRYAMPKEFASALRRQSRRRRDQARRWSPD
jgi:hypothetical protein